jgi:hypothetical protein
VTLERDVVSPGNFCHGLWQNLAFQICHDSWQSLPIFPVNCERLTDLQIPLSRTGRQAVQSHPGRPEAYLLARVATVYSVPELQRRERRAWHSNASTRN